MSVKFKLNIDIPLAPVAQKRPRFIRNSFRVYDPSAKDKIPFINFFQTNILDAIQNYSQNYKQNYKQIYKENNWQIFELKNGQFLIEKNQNFRVTYGLLPSKEPVKIDLKFYFKRPKTHFLKRGNISNRFKNKYPNQDIDNIIKFLLDCLQPQKNNKSYEGIILNDSQVISLKACKSYLNDQDLQPFLKLSLYN